jgi:serine/threonine protein phosphatase 1
MIARLFRRRSVEQAPAGQISPGERIYAIGDIHGRADLLDMLLERIREDDATRGNATTRIIFLGDLIDRGPSSSQVIERAIALQKSSPECSFLLGNHEEVFLKSMAGDLKALSLFCRIGGRETVLSYDVTEQEYEAQDYPELLKTLQQCVPAEHISFLESFEDLIISGDYAFVHAGIRPGQPLTAQKASDLRWIRREFLEHPGAHEKIIVHGHTITDSVELKPNRIGLDTGAYASGRLSAMGFEGDQRWVVDTSA